MTCFRMHHWRKQLPCPGGMSKSSMQFLTIRILVNSHRCMFHIDILLIGDIVFEKAIKTFPAINFKADEEEGDRCEDHGMLPIEIDEDDQEHNDTCESRGEQHAIEQYLEISFYEGAGRYSPHSSTGFVAREVHIHHIILVNAIRDRKVDEGEWANKWCNRRIG